MTTISKEEDATYLHVQDYLFSDFVIKAFNPKRYASYQEAAEAMMREKKLSILFEGHPNIVQAFGGSIEGVYLWKESKKTIMYSIHEHCQINTVKSIMESEGTFSVEAAIKVMKEILCALKFMHEREFAHLNLCLDNI
eukprot:CAMPEP_0197007834 /NCGR_PEP_ID=MMETSP1380-20130617/42486_1 /TAXON_ID=5936 /ORGANISM="Euplotes crassus, Strain CT5" /LENGTH=137 /DNA_ID=CAMNT_0042428117 /DNA_START=20 /DNA_END=433 /DNA_ORIENTATION=+